MQAATAAGKPHPGYGKPPFEAQMNEGLIIESKSSLHMTHIRLRRATWGNPGSGEARDLFPRIASHQLCSRGNGDQRADQELLALHAQLHVGRPPGAP